MQGTQITLGVALLVVSAATLLGSSVLGTHLAGLLPVAAIVLGAAALFVGVDVDPDGRTRSR